MSTKELKRDVEEFISMLPPAVAKALPKPVISVVTYSEKSALGQYSKHENRVTLFAQAIEKDRSDAKSTLWHELTHWVHMNGPEWYKEKIRTVFAERTKGEKPRSIGYKYKAKEDKWWWNYAGTMYPGAMDEALEVPTTHLQLLASPEKMKGEIRRHGRNVIDVLRVAATILTGEKT